MLRFWGSYERWDTRVISFIVELNQGSKGIFLWLLIRPWHIFVTRVMTYKSVLELGILISSTQPLIPQLRPAIQVDGSDDFHITCTSAPSSLPIVRRTLSPFTPTPRHLTFDQFQSLQLQHRMIDSQHPFQNLLHVSPPISANQRGMARHTEDLY